MDESTFNSLNLETGLLEDIDEVRSVGVDLAQMVQAMLQSPALRVIPFAVRATMAVYAVKAESVLRWMSQREQYYLISRIAGVLPEYTQALEQSVGGLSDALPATHPEAHGNLLQGILNSADIPDEVKEHARQEYSLLKQVQEQEHIELPPNIENILRELGGKD